MKWLRCLKTIVQYIIALIILVGLIGLFGGTVPNSIIKVFEEKETIVYKERAFEDPAVKKLNNVYKHIINPLRNKFGIIYETSNNRLHDKGSHHNSDDTTTVAADIDNDVKRKQGAVSNRELYVYIRDSMDYDQLSVGYSFKRPTYIHISIRLYEKNRKEILIKRGRNNYKKVN